MIPNNLHADAIIIIMDTRILPESESFKDKEISEVPAKWKIQCELGISFNSSEFTRSLVASNFDSAAINLEDFWDPFN
jgi:hypothetical protein